MKSLVKLGYAAALAIGGSLFTFQAANALPLAPLAKSSAAPLVQQVAGGCGPGWHPDPWGRCVPNWRGGHGFYGRPAWYGHSGWRGHGGWHGGHGGWHGGHHGGWHGGHHGGWHGGHGGHGGHHGWKGGHGW